jgi:beta-lactamase regulating signal transducer with metallopeptidase domain
MLMTLMTLLQANYSSLFNWVLTTSAKASIFIVFLLGIKFVLRHQVGAHFQYMLWSVLIIGLVLPWTPSSPVSIYKFIDSSHIQQIIVPSSNPTTQPTSTVIDTKQSSILDQTVVVDDHLSKAVLGTEKQLTSSNHVATFAIFPFIYKLMFLVWVVGILILTVLTVIVNRRFSHKIEYNLITDSSLITVFNKIRADLKIKADIPLLKTRHVNSPALLGFIHPRLLLPLGIEQTFNSEQMKLILLHELLHFKRRDIMINWITQVLVIIHWFNPLIWYAFYRMREDQEISCDALAMDRLDTKQCNDYAFTLIKLVETYSTTPPRMAGLASLSGSKSKIKRRVSMIKDFRHGSVKWSVLGFLAILLIAFAIFTGVKNGNTKPSTNADVVSPAIQPQDTKPPVATVITMEDQKQVEQLIRNYLNYINTKNYGEAWKLLSPKDLNGQTQENFKNLYQNGYQDVKAIKLISLEGYSVVAGNNGNTAVYDAKVPTVYFHLVLDVGLTGVAAWIQGRNERFIIGRKGIDGKWLISDFTSSPYLMSSSLGTNAEPEKIIVYNKGRSAAFAKGTEGYEALKELIYKKINEISENNILMSIITNEFVTQFKQQLTVEFLYSSPVEFNYPNGSKKMITQFLVAPAARSHTVITSSLADKSPYAPFEYNGGLFMVKMDSSYEELLLKYAP